MVMLYVPGEAFDNPVPPPLPPLPPLPPVLEELELQPLELIIATERSSANSVPQRRRFGTTMRKRQARVAPDPAAYHGALPVG